jgi:hypothetical protein
LILLAALALRLWHLFDPPWDYHNWRQTITLMVARDFARHGLPLLHPQVAWVSRNQPSAPSYFSGEFSIQSVLAAALYKLFGESDVLARLVVIGFSLAGIYFLYRLLERDAGRRAACIGALIYALLPYSIFFGRVFMPEIPAISLALAALWAAGPTLPFAAASLAVLQKLTVAFVALPLAFGLRRRVFSLAALLAIVPPLAWYLHSAAMARQSSFAIMQPFRLGRGLGLWFQPTFLSEVLKALAFEAFSPLGLALAVAGCCWPLPSRAAWTFRLWLMGAAAVLIATPTLLPQNHYYLAVLLPGGAGLAGLWLARLPRLPLGLLLILFSAGAIYSAFPLYEPDRLPYELGMELRRLSAPADLIVTETGGSPNVLYFSDRRGWMLGGVYDPAAIEKLHRAGARFYADLFPRDGMARPEFFTALDARFQRVSPPEAPWKIYDLNRSP